MAPAPRFLGTLLPAANRVVEPVTAALLRGLPVTPLFTRIAGHDEAAPLMAAGLLAEARPDAIVLAEGGGLATGLEGDRALVAAITARTGIPADTPGLALLRTLRRLDIWRVGLIGPHPRAVNAALVRGLAAEGIAVPAEASIGLDDTLSHAAVSAEEIRAMARRVARAPAVQAVLAWNTGMAAAPLAAALESELGLPVLDSVALGVLGGLEAAGLAARPEARWGLVFAEPVR
jgi:maleate isomerase